MNRIGNDLISTGTNREIVIAFSELSVEFIVIGGLAVAWYCPQRHADDMDLLVNPTPENSERASQALGRLRLSGFSKQSFSKLGLQVPLKQLHYAELLTPRKDGPSFSVVAEGAEKGRLFGIPVLIASPSSLIALKELAVASERAVMQKHLNDIECLKAHSV